MNLYLDVGATHIKVMYGDKVDFLGTQHSYSRF